MSLRRCRDWRSVTRRYVCRGGYEQGGRRGCYGFSEQKRDLLLALQEADAAALDHELERITSTSAAGVERVRPFTQAMLAPNDDVARVQVRADLWADLLTEDAVRQRLAEATQFRRQLVRSWIEAGLHLVSWRRSRPTHWP